MPSSSGAAFVRLFMPRCITWISEFEFPQSNGGIFVIIPQGIDKDRSGKGEGKRERETDKPSNVFYNSRRGGDSPAAFPLTFYNRRALYNESLTSFALRTNTRLCHLAPAPPHLSSSIYLSSHIAAHCPLFIIASKALRPFNLIDDYTCAWRALSQVCPRC